ncbi:MAG: hypothetical protein K8S55_01195 [Phycisphaerae bacterium]|nr:hypothetical protein [Phycisphaerae bacterium]
MAGCRWYILLSLILVVTVVAQAQEKKRDKKKPTNPSLADEMRRKAARPLAAVKFRATWYPPAEIPKNKTVPLAVILASKKFPATNDDYWVKTLWKRNFGTVVLELESGEWSNVRVHQVLAELLRCPASIPADKNRLLLIADNTSAPVALRMIQGISKRLAGAVLISVIPVEITRSGRALWSPGRAGWSVPIWAIAGMRPNGNANVLNMWRKLGSVAPAGSSLTIDTRIGRAGGFLLPDETISNWLTTIAAGKKPATGPDRQAQAEIKTYTAFAKALRKTYKAAANAPAVQSRNENISKTDGPFVISLQPPDNWKRHPSAEKVYNPKNRPVDAEGKSIRIGRTYYAEVYIAPEVRTKPFYAKIRAAKFSGTAAGLLDDFTRRIGRGGYFAVPLLRWSEGRWTYEVYSILLMWKGKWHRWMTLVAAGPGSKQAPAAPLIMVMDASGQPNAAQMTAIMKQLVNTTKVRWLGTARYNPKKLNWGK